jgi:hypothetical protein
LKVPLGLAAFDYKRRVVDITNWIMLSGDVDRDLERIRAVYKDTRGRAHELAGPIQFRDPNTEKGVSRGVAEGDEKRNG